MLYDKQRYFHPDEEYVNPIIYDTDSYNVCHWLAYKPGITELSGYIEPRQSCKYDNLSFFGIQYYIQEYLMKPLNFDLDVAEKWWAAHGEPFNRKGWEYIKDLGYLPIEIQAIPEGTWIPKENVICQIRSTDPECFWLTTWLETMLVQNVWYMSAVATISKNIKILMYRYLEETGCYPENIWAILDYMLHDFGFRGSSCREAAKLGGAAHLTNFKGTDNATAIQLIAKHYDCEMAGNSIPATNHAVITSFDSEDEAFEHFLKTFLKPGSVIACVSDSYDIMRATEAWGTKFKDTIVNSGGRLVVRPDSGDPASVSLEVAKQLTKDFGCKCNGYGYMVLPDCVRMIWGDGTNYSKIDDVLYRLMSNDIAAENIAFGMGAELLQAPMRDDTGIAFKVNERVIGGVHSPVSKNPNAGRNYNKKSRGWRQALVKYGSEYRTIPESELGNQKNILRTIFKDGKLLIKEDFETIRNRANEHGFD